MITEAIAAHPAEARAGLGRPTIKKYIHSKHPETAKLPAATFNNLVSKAITRGAAKGTFSLPKGISGKVKLASKSKPVAAAPEKKAAAPASAKAAAPKKAPAKKAAAAKPKKTTAAATKTAKKPAAKKAPAKKAAKPAAKKTAKKA
ncbi:hypothetical protein V8E36_000228 [Tilletia maclaganii]